MKSKKAFVLDNTAMWILLIITFFVILGIIMLANPHLDASLNIFRLR